MHKKGWPMDIKYFKDKRTYAINLLLIAAILLFILHVAADARGQKIKSVDGVMDLTGWNFRKDGIVSLNGEWEFYWERDASPCIIDVPSSWNHQRKGNLSFPVEGWGVYHLKIKMENPHELMALKLNYIPSAYDLYIDDMPAYSCGKTANNMAEEIPKWEVKTVFFYPTGSSVDVKIKVSNYHYSRSGLEVPIILGTADSIAHDTNIHIIFEVFLFGAIFMIGMLFEAMYFFGNRVANHMYLGIFTIVLSIRPLLYGETFLLKLFPGIPWDMYNKMFIINFGAMQFLTLFAYSIYQEEMSFRTVMASIIVQNALILAGIAAPSRWLLWFVSLIEAAVIINIIYIMLVLIRIIKKGHKKARIILCALSFMAITAVTDMLNNAHFILLRYYYMPIGLLVFTLTEFVITSLKFKESVLTNEKLKDEVALRNIRLDMEKQQRLISEKLNRVASDITSTLDLNEVLSRMLNHLYEIIPFSAAYIILREKGVLKVAASKVMDDSVWMNEGNMDMEWTSYLNEQKEIKEAELFQVGKNGEIYTAQVFPLYYKKEPIGVFEVLNKQDEIERNKDTGIIELFADQAAIAIQNAKLYDRVRRYANIDGLTRVCTRRYFKELTRKEMNNMELQGRMGSVFMLDIDYFKLINDRYGHITGDYVLRKVAHILKSTLPKDAIIGRYGGEEFVAFMPYSDRDKVLDMLERCRREIEMNPISIKQNNIKITVSIGVALQHEPGRSIEKLIKRADEALYEAKREGRNRICI